MSRCGFCDSSVKPEKTINCAEILTEYREMLGVSFPSEVLKSNFWFDRIVTQRCLVCGTISFAPQVAGDAAYYNHLAKTVSWGYYRKERWEYPLTLAIFNREGVGSFLDVGCGSGHFLRLARQRGLEGHGYDIEPDSVRSLRAEGFNILSELKGSLGRYDAIVMFQVLEHLLHPFEFLQSITPYLRRGGVLVISTPVTPSCCTFSYDVLLIPPHHQWLPTDEGYQRLASRLGLICKNMQHQPPDPYPIEYGLRKRFEVDYGMKRWFGRLPAAGKLAKIILISAKLLHRDWAQVGKNILVTLRTAA